MGIRFHCQHCQRRLNVKSRQAGMAGQCPHCQQLVMVPMESQLASRKQPASAGSVNVLSDSDSLSSGSGSRFLKADGLENDLEEVSDELDVDDHDTTEGLMAGQHANSVHVVEQGAERQRPVVRSSIGAANEEFLLDRPSPPEGFGEVDPIAEAPKKIWYLRSRVLGELGPLKSRQMQQHYDKGHVKVGSMVWREDWDDWVEAERVFPALAEQARHAKQQARLERAMQKADAEPAKSTDEESGEQLSPRRPAVGNLRVIGWVVGVGLIIVGVLVVTIIQIVARY